MKNIIFLTLGIVCSIQLKAQDFSPKQQQRLDYLGLDYNYLIQQSEANEQELQKILDMDRKRKNNLIMGTGFAGLGLLMFTGGNLIFNRTTCTDDELCEDLGAIVVGGGLMILGTFEVGVSLPLFISSIKRKKKRNKIIRELQAQYPLMP